jgi:hypothetical protein
MLKYLQNQQVSGVFFQQVKEELKVEAWPRLALPAAGLAFDDALDLVDLMERPASLVSSCTGVLGTMRAPPSKRVSSSLAMGRR